MNKYRFAACALFFMEWLIWAYIHDGIIRPYIGDLLVSILIYCAIKSFVNTPVVKTVIWVLLFCYAIEISQYFHLIVLLGLQNSKVAHMILGSYFTWVDMLCYTIGMAIVLIAETLTIKPVIQTAA